MNVAVQAHRKEDKTDKLLKLNRINVTFIQIVFWQKNKTEEDHFTFLHLQI